MKTVLSILILAVLLYLINKAVNFEAMIAIALAEIIVTLSIEEKNNKNEDNG